MNLENVVVTIPNYPKEGIMFRDVTPILRNAEALNYVTSEIAKFAKELGATVVAGPEARGFLFGTPVAFALNIGFVPVRKPGKLPRKVVSESYDLEYGSNTLCMHEDAIKKGDKVIIIDDLLATGGTVDAAIKLVEKLGGEVVGCAFVIELDELKGREKLHGIKTLSLLHYDGE